MFGIKGIKILVLKKLFFATQLDGGFIDECFSGKEKPENITNLISLVKFFNQITFSLFLEKTPLEPFLDRKWLIVVKDSVKECIDMTNAINNEQNLDEILIESLKELNKDCTSILNLLNGENL